MRTILGIESLNNVRIINRYDVEGISEELFDQTIPTVFSEPQVDNVSIELPDVSGDTVFAVESLPGQFDQRADSASECIQLISQGERPTVRSAQRVCLLRWAVGRRRPRRDQTVRDQSGGDARSRRWRPRDARRRWMSPSPQPVEVHRRLPRNGRCTACRRSSPIGAWQWIEPT
ncbi:MAG: hypothetical protein ACLUUF_06040 [Bifidobacterium pullorum]